MYTIKTRDTQQQQNPNIQYPNVVENNTNQTYKENVEDKFNVEQTIQKHRYFNFKIKTNYFKNDITDNIKITYKPVNKEFELSKDQYINNLNIYTIITSYLIIKRLVEPEQDYIYNLTKELFFKGDLIDEDNEIFKKHLTTFIETLTEYDIYDYFDKKEFNENNEKIRYAIELMFNLFNILFKKVKNSKDKKINEITLNLCQYYINFVNSTIKIILQLKEINTDNL